MNKNEKPTINTGGAVVFGQVNTAGGDFVGRNQIKTTHQGATVAEFAALLAQLRQSLPQASLDAETTQVVEADVRTVEDQAQKPQPNRAIILSKLKGMAEILATAVGAAESAQKLLPMAQRAVQWAGQLFR